jgi:hypothetical protein
LYLDEPIDSWRELADTVAERALAIGLWPDGQAEAIVAGGERVNVAPGAVERDRSIVRNCPRFRRKPSLATLDFHRSSEARVSGSPIEVSAWSGNRDAGVRVVSCWWPGGWSGRQ